MEKRIKQCVGIDCGSKELVVAYGAMNEAFDIKILSNSQFKNTPAGFKKLHAWAGKLLANEGEVCYVIEATGVYHEQIANYLYERGARISVVLPNKANAFGRTLSVKTVTDKVSAQVLAQMGLEKKLLPWAAPDKVYNTLAPDPGTRSVGIRKHSGKKPIAC